MAVKRMLALVAAVAMMLGVMALPAAAGSGVGGFAGGGAAVGKERVNECTKQGGGEVTGHGIGLPADPLGLNDPKDSPAKAYYKFDKTDGVVFADTNGNVTTNGSFHVCGVLTDVAGIGAACGMSKGYNGRGKVYTGPNFTDPLFMVQDIVWKASAGGTLPITGQVDAWNADKTKGTKTGLLVGIVQAQGGQGCVQPNKATEFIVHGVLAVVNGASFDQNTIFPKPGPVHGEKNDK